MKILVVHAVAYGVKYLLLPQIDYLLERGYRIEIACSPAEDSHELRRRGYVVHDLPIARRIDLPSNTASVYRLTRLMRQHNYDAVHLHSPVAALLGRVAARLARIPTVVYTVHGFHFTEHSPALAHGFYFQVEKWASRITDLMLTQSREDLEMARRTRLCRPEQIRYLGNGVDVDRFSRRRLEPAGQTRLRAELGIPTHAAPLIAMTGRMSEEKGFNELVAALATLRAQYPHIHAIVIGGQLPTERDDIASTLFAEVARHGLEDHLTFTGFRSDVAEILGLVDVFTLPSYREGLPRSVIEAMAMELPVVATDIRGCREAVLQRETGLLVPPRDAPALARALGELLGDVARRTAYGRAGRRRVEREFDERHVFRRIEEHYSQIGLVPR